jgi:4-oxalocrotonate tautomerase
MPVITVDIGKLDREKKEGLVRELTARASEVTRIPADKFIVLINEMERDNIGVGGKLLSEILP